MKKSTSFRNSHKSFPRNSNKVLFPFQTETNACFYFQTEEVGALVRALLHFGQRDKAAKLQSTMDTFLNLVTSSLPLIPTPAPAPPARLQPTVAVKQETDAGKTKLETTNWKLKLFVQSEM
jgi:hypothetical protein